MSEDSMDTGALGASGRFARMEAALERIESKLDLKADRVALVALEHRVRDNENKLGDVMSGVHISPNAATLIARFEALVATVDHLENREGERAAVLLAAKEKADNSYARLAAAASVAFLINLAFSIYTLINATPGS